MGLFRQMPTTAGIPSSNATRNPSTFFAAIALFWDFLKKHFVRSSPMKSTHVKFWPASLALRYVPNNLSSDGFSLLILETRTKVRRKKVSIFCVLAVAFRIIQAICRLLRTLILDLVSAVNAILQITLLLFHLGRFLRYASPQTRKASPE